MSTTTNNIREYKITLKSDDICIIDRSPSCKDAKLITNELSKYHDSNDELKDEILYMKNDINNLNNKIIKLNDDKKELEDYYDRKNKQYDSLNIEFQEFKHESNKLQIIPKLGTIIKFARRKIACHINPNLSDNINDQLEYWGDLVECGNVVEINEAVHELFDLSPREWKFLSRDFYDQKYSFTHIVISKEEALDLVEQLSVDYENKKELLIKFINKILNE